MNLTATTDQRRFGSRIEIKVKESVTENEKTRSSNSIKNVTNKEKIEICFKNNVVKDGDLLKCKICDYARTKTDLLRKHVEIHITGLVFNCKFCEKQLRTSNQLNNHISIKHRTNGK